MSDPLLDHEKIPSREQVCTILERLIAGRMTAKDVADWAGYWISLDNAPINDAKVWRAVKELSGADLISTDRPFLYGVDDFKDWLVALRAKP